MLTLFSQLPTNTKFRFEKPDAGPVFVKTNEAGAHHDGAYQRVSPSVLVFPIKRKIVIVDFMLNDRSRHVAVVNAHKAWALMSTEGADPAVFFNTLKDVINHLES